MENSEIVITGLGLITGAGLNLAENLDALREKRSPVRPIERFELPPKVRTTFAGLAPSIDTETISPAVREMLDDEDRKHDYVKAAILAVTEALDDAGAMGRVISDPEGTALIVASSLGNFLNVSELVKDYFIKDLYKITSLIHGMNSYLPAKLSSIFNIRGPNFFISSSCTSSLNGLLTAVNLIKCGTVRRVIICGCDVCLETGTFHLWNKIRVLSKRNDDPATACRPYCSTRDGMVVSEAAGAMIVERADDIADLLHCFTNPKPSRSIRPYATIAGIGVSNGSADFVKPQRENIRSALQMAMNASGMNPSDIGFIASGASGSPLCDVYDSAAICDVMGADAARIPVFPFKSHLGSTFGAQAVSEGSLALACFREGVLPEPRNIFDLDASVKARVDYDPAEFKESDLNAMAFMNYGFAGNHMAAIFIRPRVAGGPDNQMT